MHTKRCLAEAMISAIQNVRDSNLTDEQFDTLAKGRTFYDDALEYLTTRQQPCRCPEGSRDFKSNVPADTVPGAVVKVANAVAEYVGAPVSSLFVADHTHEDVSEGSWTIALEGYLYDWPFLFIDGRYEQKIPAPKGYGLEAKNGWCLLIYRDKEN